MSEPTTTGGNDFTFDGGTSRLVCSSKAGALGSEWFGVKGEVDIATARQLREELASAIVDARLVVLDLREVSFMDSAGVHVILEAAARCHELAQRLLVVHGTPQVARILALSGVERLVLTVELPTASASEPNHGALETSKPATQAGEHGAGC